MGGCVAFGPGGGASIDQELRFVQHTKTRRIFFLVECEKGAGDRYRLR